MADVQRDPHNPIKMLRLLRRFSTELACPIAVARVRKTF